MTCVCTDKAGAGRGEEAAGSVTRRPQVGVTGGAEGGNTHNRNKTIKCFMMYWISSNLLIKLQLLSVMTLSWDSRTH